MVSRGSCGMCVALGVSEGTLTIRFRQCDVDYIEVSQLVPPNGTRHRGDSADDKSCCCLRRGAVPACPRFSGISWHAGRDNAGSAIRVIG
ncbi:hypothetical protein GA0061093_12146 [Rhodococcus qingshengii]|nr:hypothetical protein GA0061093_12146 [Rhodococcus qingshengii]